MRDVESDYRDAYLAEYEMCVRAGRTENAAEIAAILRDHYGVDVAEATVAPAPEHTASERPPENTAERKPAARRPRAAKPTKE